VKEGCRRQAVDWSAKDEWRRTAEERRNIIKEARHKRSLLVAG